MAAAAVGATLAGDHVLVADVAQAARLHQKSAVGDPQPDGSLRLALAEAAWLCTQGRLEVPGGAAALLARGASRGNRTEVAFLVYGDLRSRGLVARPEGRGFRVWPRGEGPPAAPAYDVQVAAEADLVDGQALLALVRSRGVLAVVDSDGGITHYQVEPEAPAGTMPVTRLPHATGVPLAERVLVADPEAARAYAKQEFLGTPSPAGLVLSLTEAVALARRGALDVPGIEARAAGLPALPAYMALRDAGVVVKSGFRFGTHLRGYEGDPEAGHALWLIHCLAPGGEMHWSEMSRAIRLAHGVRKRFLVAVPGPSGSAPTFVGLAWFKP
ncbi:MAG TPA: hypothetical protein VM286_01845 [Candidatus Thermoplasmatota archaeon]|nr:hypothetical protein [Candidatus Thermoplasmatota archaeon]